MEKSDVAAWLDKYIAAWKSNNPQQIGDLFTEDATYYATPYATPIKGRDAIAAAWLEEPDAPGSWEAHYKPEIVSGNRAVATGRSIYPVPGNSEEWSNIFLLTFDDNGRCSEYREWYYKKPAKQG